MDGRADCVATLRFFLRRRPKVKERRGAQLLERSRKHTDGGASSPAPPQRRSWQHALLSWWRLPPPSRRKKKKKKQQPGGSAEIAYASLRQRRQNDGAAGPFGPIYLVT